MNVVCIQLGVYVDIYWIWKSNLSHFSCLHHKLAVNMDISPAGGFLVGLTWVGTRGPGVPRSSSGDGVSTLPVQRPADDRHRACAGVQLGGDGRDGWEC